MHPLSRLEFSGVSVDRHRLSHHRAVFPGNFNRAAAGMFVHAQCTGRRSSRGHLALAAGAHDLRGQATMVVNTD